MLSFIIIFTYIIYMIYKYGVPKSISTTYYSLNHKWVFSVVLLASSLLLLPKLVEFGFLGFLCVVGVIFVAYAPNFMDNELVDRVHTGSAILSLITSQLLVAMKHPLILAIWIPYVIYLIFSRNNYKFYAEIIMLFTIYLLLYKDHISLL